jgi:hypothetical protein
MANGSDIQFDTQLIATRIADIRAALQDKAMDTEAKINLMLRTQEINLMVVLTDHSKVLTMWGVFKPMAWGGLIAVTGIIGLAIAGHISVAIVP